MVFPSPSVLDGEVVVSCNLAQVAVRLLVQVLFNKQVETSLGDALAVVGVIQAFPMRVCHEDWVVVSLKMHGIAEIGLCTLPILLQCLDGSTKILSRLIHSKVGTKRRLLSIAINGLLRDLGLMLGYESVVWLASLRLLLSFLLTVGVEFLDFFRSESDLDLGDFLVSRAHRVIFIGLYKMDTN